MKAVLFNEHGGPEVLKYVEDFPIPTVKENEVLIKVHYTSLNRVDIVLRNGYPGSNFPMPHILGGDIAGEVVSVGSGVTSDMIGDRVVVYPVLLPENRNPKLKGNEQLNPSWKYLGMHTHGGYSEFVAVPVENVAKIPDDMSLEFAASLPVAGVTAYHAMHTMGRLKEGDVVHIWGGTGGMGILAVQIAKSCGATVIATAGDSKKAEKLKELGADFVFNHYNDDVLALVKEQFPGGIDCVLDYVGPATFDKSIEMLRTGGKIIICGMLTGRMVNLNIQQTYFKHICVQGIFLGSPHDFFNLIQLAAAGEIKPVIHKTFDLKDAQEAHKLMESGSYIGKIMLKI